MKDNTLQGMHGFPLMTVLTIVSVLLSFRDCSLVNMKHYRYYLIHIIPIMMNAPRRAKRESGAVCQCQINIKPNNGGAGLVIAPPEGKDYCAKIIVNKQ